MNQDCLINFVLDKSGSMGSVRDAAIQGFNAFLEDQKKVTEGVTRMSLTLFDTGFDVRFTARSIQEIDPLGSKANTYNPGGGTALLDAVGTTIKGTEAWLKNHPDFEGRIVCVILTDGEENASRQWHLNHPLVEGDQQDVGGLIQWKQNEGWEFVFLGSGGSDWLEQNFGHVVAAHNFVSTGHTNEGVNSTFTAASSSLRSARVNNIAYSGAAVSDSYAMAESGKTADEIVDALSKDSTSTSS